MTLWPISMFSRILATARPAVPATHAGGNSENSRTPRDPSSSLRCTSMTLRMYAASRSPRVSTTCWRMASSSTPRFVMSSSVRCSTGLRSFFSSTVIRSPCNWECQVLEVDVAGARGGRHTGLDQHAVTSGRGGDLAVAEIAHRALAHRHHAAEADAHPATGRHQHAGALADV